MSRRHIAKDIPVNSLKCNRYSVLAVAVFSVVTLSSCSSSTTPGVETEQGAATGLEMEQSAQPESAAAESIDSADDLPTETTSTIAVLVDSEVAELMRSRAGELASASPLASQFVSEVAGGRLDVIGAEICSQLSPEPTISAFVATGKQTFDTTLTTDEQAKLDEASWPVLFGAFTQFYCPDQLPQADGEFTSSVMEQFRTTAPTIATLPEASLDFAIEASDERLEELSSAACNEVNSSMDPEGLSVAIQNSYNKLSQLEQDQLSQSEYGQLYIALIGFFCFENVPQ